MESDLRSLTFACYLAFLFFSTAHFSLTLDLGVSLIRTVELT